MSDLSLDLSGRVALVTGARQGIGLAIVEAFAELGATVLVNHPPGAIDPARIGSSSALELECDISDPSASSGMLARVGARHGRLDILVNNAGIYPRAGVDDVDEELWDRVHGVNLKGAFFCSQAALPWLRRSPAGRIVNIASVAAVSAPGNGAHYATSKAGLIALTKTLARSLGPEGILVNAIAPGMTDTAQPIESAAERAAHGARLPLGRIATARDVARVAVFLASSLAEYVTGQVLYMHGGAMRCV